jgi:hypothetical protein
MTSWRQSRPTIDMLGKPVADGTVVRQVPSIGLGARWELALPCGHKQIFTRQAIRTALDKGTKTLRCETCKPKKDRW